MARPDIEAIRAALEETQAGMRRREHPDEHQRFAAIAGDVYAFRVMPALLAYVAKLEAALQAIVELGPCYSHEAGNYCPACDASDHGGPTGTIHHKPGCPLVKANALLTNQASPKEAQ